MSAVPLFCSVEYGCARWSCSRGYLYELLAAAKIRAVMDGRRTKIETASGDAYFSSLPEFSTRPKDRGPKRKLKTAPTTAAHEQQLVHPKQAAKRAKATSAANPNITA
jgi:hypothetical protein